MSSRTKSNPHPAKRFRQVLSLADPVQVKHVPAYQKGHMVHRPVIQAKARQHPAAESLPRQIMAVHLPPCKIEAPGFGHVMEQSRQPKGRDGRRGGAHHKVVLKHPVPVVPPGLLHAPALHELGQQIVKRPQILQHQETPKMSRRSKLLFQAGIPDVGQQNLQQLVPLPLHGHVPQIAHHGLCSSIEGGIHGESQLAGKAYHPQNTGPIVPQGLHGRLAGPKPPRVKIGQAPQGSATSPVKTSA